MTAGSSALMAIGHIFFCYILFFSFHATNNPFVYGARVAEQNKSNARPSTCSGPARGLKIVHRYGPCSPFGQKKSSATSRQVFLQDQHRVRAINSIRSYNSHTEAWSNPTDLGQLVGAGMYIITVRLGTPETEFDLNLDTGSYITWVRCNLSGGVRTPKCYVPSSSSTSSTASCQGSCDYTQSYLDQTEVNGSFVVDRIDLESHKVIPNFHFLCAQHTKGNFGEAAGILGLGRGNTAEKFGSFSLISQAETIVGKVFCYCLPTIDESSKGYVHFGNDAVGQCQNSGTYTPLLTNPYDPSNYYVDLIAITIGQKRLNIPSPASSATTRAIIDTGTVITRLPSSVYSALSSEFKELMREYPLAPADDKLDTCYDLPEDDHNGSIPNMILHFRNLDVNLEQRAVVWKGKQSKVCLAFAEKDNEDDFTIIGNHQLQKMNILHDLKGGKLGIAPGDC